MSYSDFTLRRVQADFGISVQTTRSLFGQVQAASVDAGFKQTLLSQAELAFAINTEKARSELLIAPLLAELWRRCRDYVALFSGVALDADPESGLVGRCDFIIGKTPQLHYVTAPLVVIVEAKNEDIPGGLGQCAAAMVGAQRFNRKEKTGIETIHGCVSDGGEWKFLRLEGTVLSIDLKEYVISQNEQILGILLHLVAPLLLGGAAAA
jgi:hypothetical protein